MRSHAIRSVAFVSEHASPLATLGGQDAGGQNVHVAALAKELAAQGCRVVVYTRRDDPDVPDEVLYADGVLVRHVTAGPKSVIPKDEMWQHMDEFARNLEYLLRDDRPQLVHSHFWMSGYATVSACRKLNIPVVQTFHALGAVKRRQQGSKDSSPMARLEVEAALAREVDMVIATCSDEAFELARLGVSADDVSVVPCGVDLEVFDSSERERSCPDDVFQVAVVGRLVERKGVGNVVEALRSVDNARLVIAGGSEDETDEIERLSQLARRHRVEDRIEFRGQLDRPAVAQLLRESDVAVCAPWYEPFGMVPLEAMACGTPVVASATGGLIDTVVDGVTGLHVPPRCPELIAEALQVLRDDPELRIRMGRAGARRARSRYGWSRIAAETLASYEKVIARRIEIDLTSDDLNSSLRHIENTSIAIESLKRNVDKLSTWSAQWAEALMTGKKLLAAGNGGSAAEAQHLTAELVGRYRDDRQAFSAIALNAETSSITAIVNDYGADAIFARQVEAHGRPGDVLVLFSTSGKSPNLIAAAKVAGRLGVRTYAMTGAGPNPLSEVCDEAICIDSPSSASAQEMHLVALHVLCDEFDALVKASVRSRSILVGGRA